MFYFFDRYLILKQMLLQFEFFEFGFEEQFSWVEEVFLFLEGYKNVNIVEEVEKELVRYIVSEFCLVFCYLVVIKNIQFFNYVVIVILIFVVFCFVKVCVWKF